MVEQLETAAGSSDGPAFVIRKSPADCAIWVGRQLGRRFEIAQQFDHRDDARAVEFLNMANRGYSVPE